MHKKRRWMHWVFLVAVLASLIFLVYVTNDFLNDAQMSMGPTPISGNSIDALLINRQKYTPPKDGKLRIAQVHVVLRIFEALDSMTRLNEKPILIRRNIATIMNTHLQTRASYTWSRNSVANALLHHPVTQVDSENIELIKTIRPRLQAVQHVITDTLDRDLLR